MLTELTRIAIILLQKAEHTDSYKKLYHDHKVVYALSETHQKGVNNDWKEQQVKAKQ